MAQFSVNKIHRLDPYKNFRFKIFFGSSTDPVAGISKISALKRSTEVIEHPEGGNSNTSYKAPGRSKFEAITLERGVTHDTEFEAWANKVWNYKTPGVSLKDFRRDIRIVLCNEAGQEVIAYNVFRCWVSEYQALPELDASANAVAIQSIKLENEGWERDDAVTEQPEPVFD